MVLCGGGAMNYDSLFTCVFGARVSRMALALPRSSDRESSDALEYTLSAPCLSAKTAGKRSLDRPRLAIKLARDVSGPHSLCFAPWRLCLRLRHGKDTCPELCCPLTQSMSAAPKTRPHCVPTASPEPSRPPTRAPIGHRACRGQGAHGTAHATRWSNLLNCIAI